MAGSNTAFDSSLGTYQGRVHPRFAGAADADPVSDLVAAGSTSTNIIAQLAGFQTNAFQGRRVRIGDETRKVISNTTNTIVVDSAFNVTPQENQGFTILGGEFVWALGFDFRDRREHFAFGDGIQIENHLPLTGLAFLTARILIQQPKTLINQRNFAVGATIIPTSSSTVDDITPGLPAIADFTAAGSTSTVIQLTVGGLVLGAMIGRILEVSGLQRTITANGASSITVGLAFPSPPPAGVGLRVIERGPLITTHTANHVAVDDQIAVSNVQWNGTPPTLNRTYAVRRIISATVFELEAPAGGSGTYAGGGSIGLGARFSFPAGLTDDDVGRFVQITGAANTGNNGLYQLVGVRSQPSKLVADQAWFQRADTAASLQGIVAAGSTTTVINVTSPTLVAGAHVGRTLLITDANGAAEERTITANGTATITVSPAFAAVPQTTELSGHPMPVLVTKMSNFLIRTPVVYEAVSGGTAVVGKGARWKVMLLAKNGGGTFVTCARVVQSPNQSGFFRADLRAYVKGVTADRTFAVRLELVEHNPTDIYSM